MPVFNHDDISVSKRVIKASYDAGIRVFEWTNRGASASKVFNELQPFLRDECPDIIMGAGTIFRGDMARRYVALGANFIVSPVLDPELSETCKQLGILWIPGAGTVTEIYQAHKWGADIVKVFPGNSAGGPGFIKAVLAPMPQAQLMPTGGVDITGENLKDWFEAGACCVGIGSRLFKKELLDQQNSGALRDLIATTIHTIKTLQNNRTVA